MNKQKVAKYFGWKLVRFIVLMIAVAIFSFVLLDLSPIDPVNAYLRQAAVSEAQRQILEGLDVTFDKYGTYILGGADDYITAMWPLTALTWLPGHMYTYTIDLASGGYYETDQDSNVDLDPIFEGAEIKFVTVSVDSWSDADGVPVSGGI